MEKNSLLMLRMPTSLCNIQKKRSRNLPWDILSMGSFQDSLPVQWFGWGNIIECVIFWRLSILIGMMRGCSRQGNSSSLVIYINLVLFNMSVYQIMTTVTLIQAIITNWRVSVVSKTLTGVTKLKIGDVFVYIIYVWMYVCLVLWPWHFCVCLVVDPVPNFSKQNPLVYWSLTISF